MKANNKCCKILVRELQKREPIHTHFMIYTPIATTICKGKLPEHYKKTGIPQGSRFGYFIR